jgi:hypothetical protein
MIVVPVLYATFYRIPARDPSTPRPEAADQVRLA